MRWSLAMIAVAANLTLTTGVAAEPSGQLSAALAAMVEPHGTGAERLAVRGVVKTIGVHALTMTRASRRADLLTFVLDASTARSGVIVVGALVSVRYRLDGGTRMATAVTAVTTPSTTRSRPPG